MSDEKQYGGNGIKGRFSNRFKTKYLWLLFTLWILFGQLIAYFIANKILFDMVFMAWDTVFRYVPAIMRLKDVYSFGVELARLQATAMLMAAPALFVLMLAASVEESIHGVRERKKGWPFLSSVLLSAWRSYQDLTPPGRPNYFTRVTQDFPS